MTDNTAIVVMIGGNGSNLQALIDQHQQYGFSIAGVISHKKEAYGLTRAHNARVPCLCIDHRDYSDRSAFESDLIAAIQPFNPQLIVLAGFMRILSSHFIETFPHKVINIHPSILPKWKGLNTHQSVLDAGETEHGVSVHYVTNELDGGPIIAQVKVPVLEKDTVETLAQRVHQAEHWLYPQVVGWIAQNRLKYTDCGVTFDDAPVPLNGMQLFLPALEGINP